jgi:hypothetical protein
MLPFLVKRAAAEIETVRPIAGRVEKGAVRLCRGGGAPGASLDLELHTLGPEWIVVYSAIRRPVGRAQAHLVGRVGVVIAPGDKPGGRSRRGPDEVRVRAVMEDHGPRQPEPARAVLRVGRGTAQQIMSPSW